MGKALAERYRQALEAAGTLIRAAVIVDLSGEGDAAPLALGWTAALGPQASVALWSPNR
jgi:hypothetical protein